MFKCCRRKCIIFTKRRNTVLSSQHYQADDRLVAVESHPDLSGVVTIRPEWTGVEGSSMYLKVGEKLTLETLLYGLLLCSGNDACVAIAEHISAARRTLQSS